MSYNKLVVTSKALSSHSSECSIIGEVYKHYKDDDYEVVELALHSNNDEWMVIYKPLYECPDAHLFTRPLREWNEIVAWEGREVLRFTNIG